MKTSSASLQYIQRRLLRRALPVCQEGPQASLWNIRETADENYRRCLELLEECTAPGDRLRVIGEIRQHRAFANVVLQSAYSMQQAQAFMEEVLTALGECDPQTRDKILHRLAEKRGNLLLSPPPG